MLLSFLKIIANLKKNATLIQSEKKCNCKKKHSKFKGKCGYQWKYCPEIAGNIV